MKVFEFLEKKKSLICAITIILAVLAVAVAFYCYRINNNKNLPKHSYTVGEVTGFDDRITVSEGQTVTQQYKIKTLSYKQLGMFISGVSPKCNIKINLEYVDQKTETTLSAADINLSGYTYIDLPKEIMLDKESELKIKLTAQDGDFTVSTNSSTVIENSKCTLDGKQMSTNIVVDVRTMRNQLKYTLYWVFVIVGILFLSAFVLLVKYKKISISGLCAMMLAFFCVACLFIFPPFTVPDEFSHYRAAYHVSNQLMLDFKDEQWALRMRADDYDYCSHGNNSLYTQDYIIDGDYNRLSCNDNEIITTNYGYMTNKTVVYLVPSIGISLSRILGIGPYWTFQIGRLFNIIQCIVMIYFAIKIIPFGKTGLAAISLLPINLHIMSSMSYDAFTYGGVLLVFAYIIKLIYDKKTIGWKQLLLLTLMIVLVIPQKVVYIGVAALLLIIPKDRFAKPKWHFAFKCIIGVIAVASILILQMQNASKLTADTVTNSETTGFNLSYIFAHIPQVINMLFNTIVELGDFYAKSIISYFGFFEMQTPWFMAIPFFVLVALSFMRSEDEPTPFRFLERIYSVVLFGIVFLLVEMLLLIDWTPMGSTQILGVQGRYFIPALPLLIVAARNNTIVTKKNIGSRLIFAASAMNMVVMIYCLSLIIQ